MLAFNIRIFFINVSYNIVPSLINVVAFSYTSDSFNHLKTKHRLLYLKTQSVPRC